MANQTLWVGFAVNTLGVSNSATGNPSPTYLVVESGAGTVTFTPRSPVTAVTGVDVKDVKGGTSKNWPTAAVSTDGISISDPGGATGTFYYVVSATGSNFNGTATLDPLWQQD
jgi:hypothetical protein